MEDQSKRSAEVYIVIFGKSIRVKVETCATINVLDESGFYQLLEKPKLEKYIKLIHSYNSSKPLKSKGKFSTLVFCNRNLLKAVQAEFVVMKGFVGNILGYSISKT